MKRTSSPWKKSPMYSDSDASAPDRSARLFRDVIATLQNVMYTLYPLSVRRGVSPRTAGNTIPVASFLVLAFGGTESGAGQSPGGIQSLSSVSGGDVSGRTMVFEREVFTYPAGERRNPFLPVEGPAADGPRVEDMRLLGIIHHPDSAYSLVVLGISRRVGGTGDVVNAAAGPQAGRATARLRLGDTHGRLRVVEIHEYRVVIELDEPDGDAIQVLALPGPVRGSGS